MRSKIMEFNLSYHEVIPDQTISESWKEISLNTGGTQSTLQDFKVTERANGYCYKDATKRYTRNRFIYWHINNDILEIVELSLDINLAGNKVRYKFVDTPILDGVSACETSTNVVILVPTVCSVHKLVFPHPDFLHQQDDLLGAHPDLFVNSIFSEANTSQTGDPSTFYVFSNPTANSQLPHLAASLFLDDDTALFLLTYPSNEVILVRQYANGENETLELKSESIVPRFFSGIADKFRSKSIDNNVVSMLLHTIQDETYAFTLIRDGHLRVWCCSKAQCVALSDILLETGGRQLIQGAQNHMIKKSVGDDDDDFLLAVFMSFSPENMFHILRPVVNGNQFRFIRITNLHSPGSDLVDFSLTTSRIWTMWRGEEGESQVFSSEICASIRKGCYWVPAVLEPTPDRNEVPFNSDHLEPKEAYLEYIFYPGRFPISIISKALSIYKRSAILSEVNVSASVLRQRVCMAVENEIQIALQECEVNDEEYLECANWCWQRFYSCCIQYHMTGLRALGVLLLPAVSGIVLLKRTMYSFLRPLDTLEHLVLCSDYVAREQFTLSEECFESKGAINDIIELVNVLVYLDVQLNDLFKTTFEREMAHLKEPDLIIDDLLSEVILEMNEEFSTLLQHRLKDCKDLYQAMHNILKLLRIECCSAEDNVKGLSRMKMSVNHLFSSQLGISFTSECFKQQSYIRFSLCRSLLAFQHILLQSQEQDWRHTLETIEAVCMPEVVALTRAYYVLFWISRRCALPLLPSESALQRLSPLKLNPVFNLRPNAVHKISLIELFAGSTGGYEAHKMMLRLEVDENTLAHWHTALLPYLNQLMQLVWPANGNSLLPEWLLTSGQHLWLQQYVHLMNNWCNKNTHTRDFLLAAAFLSSGDHYKAYDLFLKAAEGIDEEYLLNKMQQNIAPHSNPAIMYYLKVIQLFELHGGRVYSVDLANVALTKSADDESLVPTLYSIKFKHHLALGHYNMAYEALDANPEQDRKKDNLRDLVKTLLENKQLDTLMSLPYTGMETLFCNILYTRARACDSVNNIYYDFLYCYQIRRGIPYLRQAGSVMYEQAFRLRQHNSIEALEKQVKCYLAAVNALSLCESKFAWVLIPADPDVPEEVIFLPTLAGSGEDPEQLVIKRKVDVVELETIRKEMHLASARLRLAKYNPKSLTTYLATPHEIVMYLTSAGMLRPALSLCATFGLSYESVLETLARHCILLTEYENPNAWNWLIENYLHELPLIGNSPSSVVWVMLKTYLEELEEDKMSVLHKVVCQKIIRMGAHIPYWLIASYKKRNPGELLRLYLCNGHIEQACKLAKEHLLAAMGYGSDHFDLEHGVGPTTRAFCLPVNIMDALIYELKLQNEDGDPKQKFKNEYKDLKELFLRYLDTTARISNEICRSKSVAFI